MNNISDFLLDESDDWEADSKLEVSIDLESDFDDLDLESELTNFSTIDPEDGYAIQ